jgi:hypothetical protein
VVGEKNLYGPGGKYRPRDVVSSPVVDRYSADTWYYGDFKNQFVRAWFMQMQNETLGAGTQIAFDRDIVFQAKVRYSMGCGARDYIRVVQCLAGTTPPSMP